METLTRDLRYVARALARTPGFFIVAVLTLAIGIGATTAIFSVVNGVLLQPLPYPNADRIVQLFEVGEDGGRMNVSDANFDDLRSRSRSFIGLAEENGAFIVSVSGASEPVRVRASSVSSDFFDVLGVQPLIGRRFLDEEKRQGGAPAVLVSHGFWQTHLAANPNVLGTTLRFDSRTFTVVGVLPATVSYPVGVDLWVPRELDEKLPSRSAHNWHAVGRLRDGVSLAQAQAEISALARALRGQYGEDTQMVDAAIVPLRDQMVGKVRPALLILLGASGALLLIACANVVNLLVARMASRQGELAVRLALGAGRARLIQQFLTESLVLALAGGLLGVILAAVGVQMLLALEPGNLPRLAEVRVSLPVFLFALGLSVVTATAIGLITAVRATRGDVHDALAQSQRTQGGAGSSYQIRSTLVVAQVAITLVLLVGAGLLARSFLRLMQVDPGFRTERTVVLDLSTEVSGEEESLRRTRFYEDLIARLQGMPGVSAVGGANVFPLAGGSIGNGTFLIMRSVDERLASPQDFERLMRNPATTGNAEFRVASGGYFRAMNIPLVRGRLFDERDVATSPHVAVISASLAKARWPTEEPIGKVIQFGNMDGNLTPFTIVGIVGDVRESSLAADPRPTFYADFRQRPLRTGTFHFVIQGTAEPTTVIANARRIVSELRPDLPPRFRTIETVVSQSIADRRFVLLLLGVFGAAALLLATLGVYSVISYLVTQRRQEIGIRVALGARTEDVLRMVLRQGASLALIGIAIGAVAALGLTRLLSGLLFGISTTDPVAFVAVIATLTGVALLASYLPARRAAQVEPMSILRGG